MRSNCLRVTIRFDRSLRSSPRPASLHPEHDPAEQADARWHGREPHRFEGEHVGQTNERADAGRDSGPATFKPARGALQGLAMQIQVQEPRFFNRLKVPRRRANGDGAESGWSGEGPVPDASLRASAVHAGRVSGHGNGRAQLPASQGRLDRPCSRQRRKFLSRPERRRLDRSDPGYFRRRRPECVRRPRPGVAGSAGHGDCNRGSHARRAACRVSAPARYGLHARGLTRRARVRDGQPRPGGMPPD